MKLEAWIDVGGTFTDCLVRTDSGQILRNKTLSSGRVPVSPILGDIGLDKLNTLSGSPSARAAAIGSDQRDRADSSKPNFTELYLGELRNDCDGFWVGAELHALNSDGQIVATSSIRSFRSGGIVKLNDPIEISSAIRFEINPGCEAPVLAVRRLLKVPLEHQLPPITVRLGTTRGTNALLTRNGAKVALLITEPFEDLLEIGDQTRPELFALDIDKSKPLARLSLGIRERLNADGSVSLPLDLSQAGQQLNEAKAQGCNSLAISLMHSYRNPTHELQLAQLAHENGFSHVSVSHQLATVVEFVARTQTTVVDAYLSPIIREYFSRLYQQFGGSNNVDLLVMTSAGGLIDWQEYSGKDCILSGPAGGVVSLTQIQTLLDQPVIGLDMGGTSTDVSRAGQHAELQYESTKAGVRILTPTLPIETVAAGGGSICWFDGVSLRVGPQSAGAFPGPACYGRGGPLTITDLNVASGRIPASQFPFPIDHSASLKRIDQLLEEIQPVLGKWTRAQLVDGLRRLANEQMADAVRTVSIQQGVDPRDHSLVGFGGAAGQHICEIADALGVESIIDHADAGLLSAVGMGLADLRRDRVLPIYKQIQEIDCQSLISQAYETIQSLASQLVHSSNSSNEFQAAIADVRSELNLELRYIGTDSTLVLPIALPIESSLLQATQNHEARPIAEFKAKDSWTKEFNPETLSTRFASIHQQRFGYIRENRPLEAVALRVSVLSGAKKTTLVDLANGSIEQSPTSQPLQPVHLQLNQPHALQSGTQERIAYPCVPRNALSPGQVIEGPAIILNSGSTLAIEPGWRVKLDSIDMLRLTRYRDASEALADSVAKRQEFDPVLRDCYAQRLSAIASQMGHVLQQTAVSVNVKQRRDYSCAIFDASGRLLANAPHVPVHLGAMGVTVRAIIERFPHMQPGDDFLCNDPYCGGSHLPDLTLVRPVFASDGRQPSFFVANRAHHADIGGIAPGSMSIMASVLEQEGVVISPFQLTDRGESQLDQLERLIKSCPYPPRNWTENVADLNAQQAACLRGEQLLSEYAAVIGWSTMREYADHLLDAGQARIEQFIERQMPVRFGLAERESLTFSDELEDGTAIQVSIRVIQNNKLSIDFEGTGAVSSTNLNANPSIVTAAVLYVLRCLIDDDVPLSEGVLRAVELKIPSSVLNPSAALDRGKSPAVAAGNVETSQRVVDVLLGAFGVAAASQGTMNNVLFGNSSFGFYETICGGSGATARADGASAVHTHMTNTRLTDPEVLELRYPVRLIQFQVRRGSGGKGKRHGGDGVIRGFEFLQPVTLSLLTSRRKAGPFGLNGGQSGSVGENWLLAENSRQKLSSSCQINVPAHARLIIHTPGGGGFGSCDFD